MSGSWRKLIRALVATASLTLSFAHAEEFHYVVIFGSQSHPKLLRYTHTWATFVRAVGQGTDPANYRLEHHTISWLPATLDVRVWAISPEPGVNLDHEASIQYALRNNESITAWGPFRISPLVYTRSLEVRSRLDSGQVRYRAISGPLDLSISDCIHAVAEVDPVFGRDHYPLIRIGKPASRYLSRQIMTRSPFEQAANDNAWLISPLRLDQYPIEIIPPSRIPKRNCLLCRCPE